jgi:Fibronectin type-III domain/Bacterial pre-peptidase C-terminal domain
VSVEVPAGTEVTVSPSTLKLRANGSASYTVKITRTSAAFGTYTAGSLTWSDGTHRVRSMLVVRPVPLAAPNQVNGTGTDGSATFNVTSGFGGTVTTAAAGLVAGNVTTSTLTNPSGGAFPTTAPAPNDHVAKITVTVPAGTTLARFSTFDADVPAGSDVDLYVYQGGTTTLVGNSGGGTAEEEVNLQNPAAGTYDVYVDLFALGTGVTSEDVPLVDFELGLTAAGNLTATPASQAVSGGDTFPVTATWSGLAAGTRYLGRVTFGDGTSDVGSTLVRVDG